MPSRCADDDARATVRAAIARRRRAMPRDVDRDAADANASSVPAFMGAAPARRRATSTSEAEDETNPKRWRDASNDARHRCAAIAEAAFDALARRARVARDANRAIDVPDDALEALAWLYGAKHLQKALEVIQAGRVRRVVAETSGRSMYAVHGSGAHEKSPYLCFPAHFCSCRSFFWECVNRGEALACKHQLAAKLASVLRCAKTTTVDDVLLGNMMMKSFEDDPM
jgi:predicted nucleic acid-binding Zn finger protein